MGVPSSDVFSPDEMITKVRPIVDDVRKRGDAALIAYAAKFDKAQLIVVRRLHQRPWPLTRRSGGLDQVYSNIRQFHEAQADRDTRRDPAQRRLICKAHQASRSVCTG